MEENSINKQEVDNGIKISIPIISNQEIENTINTENLYDKIAEQIYHDREMIILQEFIKKLQKENKELKEYIAIAPNLDEMTATKYRNIQQDAYIQGRAEEQQKAERIIHENYIPIQKIKDKIEEEKLPLITVGGRRNKKTLEYGIQLGRRQTLQELLESEEK